ncbi:MAG: hypothetical protein P8R42_29260 [Candidatus Binatia bacterium]|nr:hypothetical protein [Candidatus Binatia bacterium]
MTRFTKSVAAVVAGLALIASAPIAWADEVGGEEIIVIQEIAPAPSVVMQDDPIGPVAVFTDLIIGRPTLFMAGIAGAAFYVLSLPITLPSGTEQDARDTFLLPAQQFVGTTPGGKLDPT